MKTKIVMPERVKTSAQKLTDKMDAISNKIADNKRMRGYDGDMMLNDYIDLRKLNELLKQGEIMEAAMFAYHLDTEVQEEIPVTLYQWLNKLMYESWETEEDK